MVMITFGLILFVSLIQNLEMLKLDKLWGED